MNAKWIIGYSLLVVLIGCGCSDRIRGGSVFHTSPTGSTTRLQQSQDPQAPSTIDNSSERTMTFTLPAGSKIEIGNGAVRVARVQTMDRAGAEQADLPHPVFGGEIGERRIAIRCSRCPRGRRASGRISISRWAEDQENRGNLRHPVAVARRCSIAVAATILFGRCVCEGRVNEHR